MASSIQILRSNIAKERPFPGNLLDGQPAINTNQEEPGLFFKASDGTIVKFGPAAITSDGNPPNTGGVGQLGNTIGELWLDKSQPIPVLKVYDGVQWVDAGSGGGSGVVTLQRWVKTASGGETSASGPDNSSQILSYTPDLEEVFLNGVLLTRNTDYFANTGTSITSLAPLTPGDEITVLGWTPFNILGSIDGSNLVNGTVSGDKLAPGAVTNSTVAANAAISSAKINFVQSGVGAQARTVENRFRETVSVRDFGAVGDGLADDTQAIRNAMEFAAGMYNQVAFPPAGGPYNPPTLFFPTGAYRITDTIDVFNGLTVAGQAGIAHTVEATRIIMDTQGGTVNLNKNIFNLTRTFQGVPRSNNWAGTIEDIGFWITNPLSTIVARGGIGWGVDPVTGIGSGGTGSCIYIGENTIDARIRRCNFYSAPNAAIFVENAPVAGFYVEDCEFDTPTISIRAKDTNNFGLRVNGCEFFSGSYQIHVENCTGTLFVHGSDFSYNARIKIFGTNRLRDFSFLSNLHEGSTESPSATFIESNAVTNTISANSLYSTPLSTILLTNSDGGVITGNKFQNAGSNSVSLPETSAAAAVKLVGCQGMAVSGNSIVTTDASTYNGFGILCLDNGARTSQCMVSGNCVKAAYDGANYRAQSRDINVSGTDSSATNLVV